jgi:hypothetical protein
MADPDRRYDPDSPVGQDPFNPAAPRLTDPVTPDSEIRDPVEEARRRDGIIDEEITAPRSSSGSGLIVGAVIVILAAIAFYAFRPGNENTAQTPPPTDTTTTSSTTGGTMAPEPDATAPAGQSTAPATGTQSAPAQ